jgi:hypothetical protein
MYVEVFQKIDGVYKYRGTIVEPRSFYTRGKLVLAPKPNTESEETIVSTAGSRQCGCDRQISPDSAEGWNPKIGYIRHRCWKRHRKTRYRH